MARWFGRELRIARVSAGLTQQQLGRLAKVSQPEVSRAERGGTGPSLSVRCRLAAACGHELWWRLQPVATVSLRDSGQLAVANVLLRAAHPLWTPVLESPVGPGDARAADVLFSHVEEVAQFEIERGLVDFQGQLRTAQLKRQAITERELRPVRLVLAVIDTKATRDRLAPHADLIARSLPVPSRRVWAALRAGEPIGGDGLLLIRMRSAIRGATTSARLPASTLRASPPANAAKREAAIMRMCTPRTNTASASESESERPKLRG